mmetsp:Transcript_1086/g.1499  ORF Transcript_1086/g.1499 Transcript_1086/m.1499 type:complete len:125 (+) Transcript_1086:2-376(+)
MSSPSVPLSSRLVHLYNGFQNHGKGVVDTSSDHRHDVTNYFRNMSGLMDTTTTTTTAAQPQHHSYEREQESPPSPPPVLQPTKMTLASFALQQTSFAELPITDDPTVLTTSATDYFRSVGGFQK